VVCHLVLKKTLELPELETIISTDRGERSFHSGYHLKKRTREANKDNGAAKRSSAYEKVACYQNLFCNEQLNKDGGETAAGLYGETNPDI